MTGSGPPAGEAYVFTRDRWRVRAGEWVLFALAWSFRWITWPVGTWALTGALAPLGGWVALAVPGFRRRAARNLAHVWPHLGPVRRRAIVAEAGRQFLRLMIEYARLDRWAREVAIETQGLDTLRHVLEEGRGAVLVTAHYGNWEAVRLAARRAGIESGIIYRAFNNRYLDRFTLGLIPCCGEPVLQKGAGGLRALIGHLRRGGVVMILVDQRNSGAPLIPFLGRPAETMVTAAELAQRCGAALIPAVARRDAAGRRFAVRFEAEIAEPDPEAALAAVNARIGAWVEEAPGQWFWFHRRWRTAGGDRP